MQRHVGLRLAHALLTSAKRAEVLARLRTFLVEQLEDYPAVVLTTDRDVEETAHVRVFSKRDFFLKILTPSVGPGVGRGLTTRASIMVTDLIRASGHIIRHGP